MKTVLPILLLLCATSSALSNEEGFTRYQTIIDRQPFGEMPLDESEETKEISINESFARGLRLSMLFEGADGIRVGFIDSTKNDKSFILGIGESMNGIELIEADIKASEALLKKGNEVALFKLKADEQPKILSNKDRQNRRGSYAERRAALLKKKEEERKAREAERPQMTPEELKAHLEAVQMDAIRTGKPPLPLPLTPAMDAQLVKEGYLDPL